MFKSRARVDWSLRSTPKRAKAKIWPSVCCRCVGSLKTSSWCFLSYSNLAADSQTKDKQRISNHRKMQVGTGLDHVCQPACSVSRGRPTLDKRTYGSKL